MAIAASLVLGPDLLLADEPVSMLDVSVRAGVLALLDRLRRDGQMAGEAPNPVDVPTGCRFHPRCPIAVERCSSEDPALQVTGSPSHEAACLLA